MKILVLNSGSSSQKSCLYDIGNTLPEHPPAPVWAGKIEWDGNQADVQVQNLQGDHLKDRVKVASRSDAIDQLLDTLWNGKLRVVSAPSEIAGVGHRIVHGGKDLGETIAITPRVKSAIASMSAFAPLHNRAELEGIEIIEKRIGTVLQVAVFDTAFHSQLPEPAAVYPGPYEWLAQGIRRYGFHGINHQYCAERTAQLLGRDLRSLKLVTCHLGNGCSLAAIREGRSIDTTMGFTPLEGLMMGTRSGSVDPGILTYLMRQGRLEAQEIDDVLNKESGLWGISGISADMREVMAAAKGGHGQAGLALGIYTHRVRQAIGALAVTMGGVDAIVFAGGVGEHAPSVRWGACKAFGFLGLKLDAAKNAQSPADQDIATADSTVRVLIVQTQEDWSIAKECWKIASSLPG